MLRVTAFSALALILIGCDEPVPPQCALQPSAPTADTAIGFKVDGRQVLQDSGGFYPQIYYYTAGGFVAIFARVGEADTFQDLSIRLNQFHGAGPYPIYAGAQAFPFASAQYSCMSVPGEQWLGNEIVPDTVYVTGYDSVAATISGTFHFRATGYRYGGVVEITSGTFQGFATKY